MSLPREQGQHRERKRCGAQSAVALKNAHSNGQTATKELKRQSSLGQFHFLLEGLAFPISTSVI